MSTQNLQVNGYATIQLACDNLTTQGGLVFAPAGYYDQTVTVYTPCDRPCHIVGEGMTGNGATLGTVIRNQTGTDIVRLRGNQSSLRNICLEGGSSPVAANEETGRGVVLGRRTIVDPHPLPSMPGGNTEVQNGNGDVGRNYVLEDVNVRNTGGWAIAIPGAGKLSRGGNESAGSAGVTISIYVTMNRVHALAPKKYGGLFVGAGNTTIKMTDSSISWCGLDIAPGGAYYAWTYQVETMIFDHVNFEGRCPGNAWVSLAGWDIRLMNCRWEEDPGDTHDGAHIPPYMLELRTNTSAPNDTVCVGVIVFGPEFARGGTNGGYVRAIQLQQYCRDVAILKPELVSVTNCRSGANYIDTQMIDLGGNLCTQISVWGAGNVRALDGTFPAQYFQIPADSIFFGYRFFKLAQVTDAFQADSTQTEYGTADGIALNWDLCPGSGGGQIGCMQYGWGGKNSGRRLVNNAPRMLEAERDLRTAANWCLGDVVQVTDGIKPGLQVRYTDGVNTGWKATGLVVKGTALAPTTGLWFAGEFVIASDNIIYVCVAGGTPGTWKKTVALT